MKVPADESPININQVIDFYTHQKVPSEYIRNSIEHLSWKDQMEKVINSM
jgi:hypothetical protein